MILRYAALIILHIAVITPHGASAADRTDSGVRMMETIRFLASPEMNGRSLGAPELDKAAAYIAKEFEAAGLMPGGDSAGSWYQEWTDPETGVKMRNVIGFLPGGNPAFTGQNVVVGAHYDHLGVGGPGSRKENAGKTHPGADDNASGVAVLIDLVRSVSLKLEQERTIVFAAFTGEETGKKGSRWYVRNHKQHPASKCIAMINLDTVGRLGRNKLVVIGGESAKEWPEIFSEIGKAVGIEIAFAGQDLDSSDQKSFHEAGVPAVQLFSGAHADYHRPTDTPDKIDEKGLAKAAIMARAAVLYLANLPLPLTATLSPAERQSSSARSERRVTLGVIPDFTYNKQGVRLTGASPGGPAAGAGLREGDIVIRMDDRPILGLKDMSEALKAKQPGDRVTVHFLRQGKEMKAAVVLKEK